MLKIRDLVMLNRRPTYNFSVWLIRGNYSDRLISTFTKKEAEAWKRHFESIEFKDVDEKVEVRNYDYR